MHFCPMNLIIDQGNTQFKIGLFNHKDLVLNERFDYNDEKSFKASIAQYQIQKVIISSVVDQKLDLSFLQKATIIHLSHETALPIQILYHTPETLGHDRIANAVAAWVLNPDKNSLIIDIGTCIKYDLVNAKGEYLGGNIAPGLQMRYKALHDYTDQLPKLKPNKNLINSYGIDTQTSLECGVQLGIWHEIKGFIERYKNEFSQLTIFMTGGDLNYFDKTDKKSIFADRNYTLFGLNEILNHNA